MDAPERADVNSDEGDGTADEPGKAHGDASAFRRALDAQAAVDGPGNALVPSGPHDLTVSIERARILEALAAPQSAATQPAHAPTDAEPPTTQSAASAAAEAETAAGAREARTRVPPWSPSIHWVKSAKDGAANGATAAQPTGTAAGPARPPHTSSASPPEHPPRAGSPFAPTPDRGGRGKPGWLWRAVGASAALAAVAAIVFVLVDSASTPNLIQTTLPAEPSLSGAAALPAASTTGGTGPASPTAKASGSVTASRKPSPSPHTTASATTKQTTATTVNETATPSAAGTGTVAGTSASTKALAGPALANGQSGECLGTSGSTYSSGTAEQVAACSGSAAQKWTLTSSGQLTQDAGTYCLDDYNWESSPGSEVDLWPCNGGSNQQWTITSAGSIVSAYSNLCVSLNGQGTAVELEHCDSQAIEQWSWH
jgi:hypothetical protein